jgi:hypothetical protein
LRNSERGKSKEKSWYQYVFLGVARENEATVEGKGQELLTTIPGRSIDEDALNETGTKGQLFLF